MMESESELISGWAGPQGGQEACDGAQMQILVLHERLKLTAIISHVPGTSFNKIFQP